MFVQATDAAAYPPLVNAAVLMAEQGWQVTVINAPMAEKELRLPRHELIDVRNLGERPSHVMEKPYFARYTAEAARLAWQLRPDVVYASDQLGAGPGLLAAKAAGARLVYHEHDSPASGAPRSVLGGLRARAARAARLVVFPNAERARIAQLELGFEPDRLRIVWNLPRRAELPVVAARPDAPLIVYYHGSITPERLPMAVVEAVCRFNGAVRLLLAGYEVASSEGYIARLVEAGTAADGSCRVQYLGLLASHELLLAAASKAHVGLAFMPMRSDDLNMQHMTGASNKIFDYMACNLATVVSDLPDWRQMFVAPGIATACDPENVEQLVAAFGWFIAHPDERRAIAGRNRAKVVKDWNYDTAFVPVMAEMCAWCRS